MKIISNLKTTLLALIVLVCVSGHSFAGAGIPKNSNEKLVLNAMTELFIKRNTSILNKLWADDYKQHNPGIANGHDQLVGLIHSLPANFKYEPGFITSNADIVMLHGRYTGLGPKPLIIVDIFRIKGHKLVEHWDVTQEEVPASSTKSGNTMFNTTESK